MAVRAQEAFINEINQHAGIIFKVSRLYASDADERDDLRQEMLFQLWKAHAAFRGHSKFSTWMYRICLNTAITYRAKAKRRLHVPISDEHLNVAGAADHDVETSIRVLYRAIEKLSPVNKAIVLLYLEDQSYEEIAEITGLTKTNVSVRLVRIKKELETYLTKDEKN